MKAIKEKIARRLKRHRTVRKRVAGTAERPRLCVHRSLGHIYCQLIDDEAGRTLVSAATMERSVREQVPHGGNIAAAKQIGTLIAKRALEKGITQVVFDRGGYRYHGRVKTLADAAREAGLKF